MVGADAVITIDWLGELQVAIFTNEEDFIDTIKDMGGAAEKDEKPSRAFCNVSYINDLPFFSLVFFDTAYDVIVHETSHLVDNIFEHRGIEGCTETRAHFHAWLFRVVCKVLKKQD